jgi:hypothetical protein
MLKRILIVTLVLASGLISNSCSKEDPTPQPPTPQPAKLKMMVRESLSTGEIIPQAKARIELYKTEDDWLAKTNAVADVIADDNGDYTFENLEAINYLFNAESADGSKSNATTGNQTGVLKSNETKTLQVFVK